MRRFPYLVAALVAAALAFPASAGEPVKGAAAAKSPQAAAYLAWIKAVKGGDWEGWKKVVPAEAPAQMEAQAKEMGKKPKDILELLAAMAPDENQIRDLKVDGNKAVLRVIGHTKGETEPSYVTVEMIQEKGAWKVGKQSSSNTDK